MMCCSEPVCFQLPVLEDRFTSSELEELLSFIQSQSNNEDEETSREPVSSNSGSDGPVNRALEETDEKKRKRKISNRESARRSRWRKKRHLEDLTAQVNRLAALNRDYKNRLSVVLYQLHVVRRQNDRFRVEHMRLNQRHSDLNQVLQAVQLKLKTGFVKNPVYQQFGVEGNGPLDSQYSLQRYTY